MTGASVLARLRPLTDPGRLGSGLIIAAGGMVAWTVLASAVFLWGTGLAAQVAWSNPAWARQWWTYALHGPPHPLVAQWLWIGALLPGFALAGLAWGVWGRRRPAGRGALPWRSVVRGVVGLVLLAAVAVLWTALASAVFLATTGLDRVFPFSGDAWVYQWWVYAWHAAAHPTVRQGLGLGAGVATLFFGLAAWRLWQAGGSRLLRRDGVVRGTTDNHGHADWMEMAEARRRFPGPHPDYGGVVVGEAYRVDRGRGARGPFDPADRRSWGRGGMAPLLIDPCAGAGPTHALAFAGSGGFKTTSLTLPTLLTWTGAAVVLDPSREAAPMVSRYRHERLEHRIVLLDPAQAGAGFNALDWFDPAHPLAETHLEDVVGWLCGERHGTVTSGSEFFRDTGKTLVTCLLADLLWDRERPKRARTLRALRERVAIPEDRMRALLIDVHVGSDSQLARELAGTLMGLVKETFSGVYANANRDTRWLSTAAFADLVSGEGFETNALAEGKTTVFVQVPMEVLHTTPALGRVVIGALLKSAYLADGGVKGRILFLLDEVARLGYMQVIEQARDAGRKYGLTLVLLYQSLGQLVAQWGREGKRTWYECASWRLFAAVGDPETAREISELCGEHGVVAVSEGDSRSRPGWGQGVGSSGRSENRTELRRALIKPDEVMQDTRTDEAFVFLRNARPLRCGRAIHFRRPEWRGLLDGNRFHSAGRAALGRSGTA